MLYLFGRTTGHAQEHLQPKFDFEAENRYTTVQEMLAYLASIYEEDNREEDSRAAFHKLYMKKDQTFPEFYTEFLHLAGKGRVHHTELRSAIKEKITTELQRLLLPTYNLHTSYEDVAKQCMYLDKGLRTIQARESRFRPKDSKSAKPSGAPTAKTPNPLPGAAPRPTYSRTTPAREASAGPTRSTPEIQQLYLEGKCFICKQQGHRSRECPLRESVIREMELRTRDTSPQVHEEDSGKEEP